MSNEKSSRAIWSGVIRRYAAHLPVDAATSIVTLHEGNTPLVRAPRLAAAIGGKFDLHLKCEGLNPTGSFKDRGMTLAVTKARERGAKVLVCASTGNTSASAAAYAARAGLRCVVLIPEGKIALGKLAQALMCGAMTLQVRGNFDTALALVRQLGETGEVEIVNSINPVRIEGQKTAAFEICDALGDAPDYHFLPVGNAGNITAYWKGYSEYHAAGECDTLPRMMGFQAAGAAPIVDGAPVAHPETVAAAIRIGNPASWQSANAAIAASSGHIGKVTDAAILEAYKLAAATEGIFVEPASAVALAGVIQCQRAGLIDDGTIVVVTLTGHGLKDPDTAVQHAAVQPVTVESDLAAVKAAMGI